MTVSLFVRQPNNAPVSAQLFYKLETAAGFDSIAMSAPNDSLRQAVLPPHDEGDRIQYYVVAHGAAGIARKDPDWTAAVTVNHILGGGVEARTGTRLGSDFTLASLRRVVMGPVGIGHG